jgi:antitoxin component YwqK of YwqJK toxin-antitoxin module
MARTNSSLARIGWGLTLALAAMPAMADEPILREPKPLSGAAVAPALVPSSDHEVIRERYPNRNVKVERYVIQDADGNYVNHGSWTMWDEQGRVMGSGEYQQGKRQGSWVRNFNPGEAEILSGPLAKLFTAPFAATATFEDDLLNGKWTVVDAKGSVVIDWSFRQGKRHGKCVWHYPNGELWRSVEYIDGEPNGDFNEWSPEGELIASEKYVAGAREMPQVEFHSPGVKKTEAQFLMAKEITEVTIDWWKGVYKIKVVETEGKDQRHGAWTTWHKNGQIASEGHYKFDRPDGVFTFWHANGQKAIEGAYDDGVQCGRWTWWHENGQKSIQGGFDRGEQVGAWAWWQVDGKLTENAVFSDPLTKPGGEIAANPSVAKPHEQQPSVPAPNEDATNAIATSDANSKPARPSSLNVPTEDPPTPVRQAVVSKSTRPTRPIRQAVRPAMPPR